MWFTDSCYYRWRGIPEVAPSDRVSILSPPGDVILLAKALKQLVVDSNLRKQMTMAGRQHAETHFDSEKNTERLSRIMEQIVKRRQKSKSYHTTHTVQMVDLTSNTPHYTEALANALKTYPEILCRASPNWMESGFYKDCGLHDDLMVWVFRMARYCPILRKKRILWRTIRIAGYFTAWCQVIISSIYSNTKIIHIQWCMLPVFDIIFFIIARLLGLRMIYTVHNALPHNDKKLFTKWKYCQLYRLAHALIVLSNAVRHDLLEFKISGIEDKIYLIPHGILKPRIPVPSRKEARCRLKLCEEDEMVLFFGRISAYKGIADLIDSFSMVIKTRPQMKLFIAGNPDEPFDSYEEIIKNNGLQDKVMAYPEFVKEEFKMVLYMAADVCILPYRAATQSGSGMEFLAMGKPIIATNVGGNPDLIVHGKNGYLITPKSSMNMASAMLKFFQQSREEQQSMGKFSHRLGIERFDWNILAQKHISLYKSLVSVKVAKQETLANKKP